MQAKFILATRWKTLATKHHCPSNHPQDYRMFAQAKTFKSKNKKK